MINLVSRVASCKKDYFPGKRPSLVCPVHIQILWLDIQLLNPISLFVNETIKTQFT